MLFMSQEINANTRPATTIYFINPSVLSDALLSQGMSSQRNGHGMSLHLFLFLHSLLACSIPPPRSATLSCMYFFFYPILLSYNCFYSPPRVLFHSHFFFTYFTSFFLSIWPNHHHIFFHSFHCNTSHSICTRSYDTPFITLTLPSCHVPWCSSDHSFSQHTLLIAVPYSMSKSLFHTSMLVGEYCSIHLSLFTVDTLLPLIILQVILWQLPFTALSIHSPPSIAPCLHSSSQIFKLSFHPFFLLLKVAHIFLLLVHSPLSIY